MYIDACKTQSDESARCERAMLAYNDISNSLSPSNNFKLRCCICDKVWLINVSSLKTACFTTDLQQELNYRICVRDSICITNWVVVYGKVHILFMLFYSSLNIYLCICVKWVPRSLVNLICRSSDLKRPINLKIPLESNLRPLEGVICLVLPPRVNKQNCMAYFLIQKTKQNKKKTRHVKWLHNTLCPDS